MAILGIEASQRLDSRGNPTVQVVVKTEHGMAIAALPLSHSTPILTEIYIGSFRSIVPSGASTGKHEAVELRDSKSSAFGGKGVTQGLQNVKNTIAPALVDKKFDPKSQLKEIDAFMKELDGTPTKSKLGANAILGVSMACARAGAAAAVSVLLHIKTQHQTPIDCFAQGKPLYEFIRGEQGLGRDGPYILPVPFLNVLNGGVHSDNTMAFQEVMIAPTGATSFEQAVQIAAEVYQALKNIIGKSDPTGRNFCWPLFPAHDY